MRVIVPLLLSLYIIVGASCYSYNYPQYLYRYYQDYAREYEELIKHLYPNWKFQEARTQLYDYIALYYPYYRPNKPKPDAEVPVIPSVPVKPPEDEGSGGGPLAYIKPRRTRSIILRKIRK